MLQAGKTKLTGREMFKIMELYEKDDEQWAKIQKHESQFKSKEYDLKLTEIIPIHDQLDPNYEDASDNHDDHDLTPRRQERITGILNTNEDIKPQQDHISINK